MSVPKIETPRGAVVIGPDGKAQLIWNPSFQPKWQKQFSQAQYFLDSEVLRLCEPYTPMLTGMLIKSGQLGTELGNGDVAWIAPYAHRQYYLVRKTPSTTGPLRGSYWFDRMKEVSGDAMIKQCKVIAGGKK